jgi:hypothetical protein
MSCFNEPDTAEHNNNNNNNNVRNGRGLGIDFENTQP